MNKKTHEPKESARKQLLLMGKSVAALLSAESISLILMAGFSIAFGRVMGAEIFGAFTLSFIVTTLVRLIVEAGYEYRLPRELGAEPSRLPNLIIEAQTIKNLLWLIVSPIGLIIGYITIGSAEFVILLVWTLPLSLNVTFKSALRGLSKMKEIAKYDNIYNISLFGALFIVLFIMPSIEIVFLFFILFEIAKSVSLWICLKKNSNLGAISYFRLFSINVKIALESSDERSLFSLLKKQLELGSLNFFGAVQYRIPLIIIGIIGVKTEMGYYSAGMRFLTFARALPGAILAALLPEFASRAANREKSGLALFSAASFGFGIAVASLIFVLAEPLMLLTFDFEPSIIALKILAWTFPFIMLNQALEAYLLSYKAERKLIAGFLLSTLIIIVATLILYPLHNISGAAFAAVIGEAVLSGIYILFVLGSKKNSDGT